MSESDNSNKSANRRLYFLMFFERIVSLIQESKRAKFFRDASILADQNHLDIGSTLVGFVVAAGEFVCVNDALLAMNDADAECLRLGIAHGIVPEHRLRILQNPTTPADSAEPDLAGHG